MTGAARISQAPDHPPTRLGGVSAHSSEPSRAAANPAQESGGRGAFRAYAREPVSQEFWSRSFWS